MRKINSYKLLVQIVKMESTSRLEISLKSIKSSPATDQVRWVYTRVEPESIDYFYMINSVLNSSSISKEMVSLNKDELNKGYMIW